VTRREAERPKGIGMPWRTENRKVSVETDQRGLVGGGSMLNATKGGTGSNDTNKFDLLDGIQRTRFSRVGICDEQRLVRSKTVLDRFPLRFHILERLYSRRDDPTTA